MTRSTRRNLIKSASVASLASLVGLNAPAQKAPAPAKSKRDLMLEVLNMEAKPGYVPAGFFMHFGVRGDAAIKAHLDHFRGTGMDFVKIQFDEQTLPSNDQIKTPQDWNKFPVYPEKWFGGRPSSLRAATQDTSLPGTGGFPRLRADRGAAWPSPRRPRPRE